MNLRFPRKDRQHGRGYVILLDGMEHLCAAFTRQAGIVDILPPETIDNAQLWKTGRSGKHLSLCFSPRLIYADTGDFTNVSSEATYAHILSTVEKLRLFHEDYRIAYTRIGDIDATKSTYSYLAIAKSETDVADLLDEDNSLVDMLCPVEASLTAALALVDKEMAIVVLEDARHIRIVGAKNGIVYYLITINISDSFDPEADTVAGINEMKSLLMNSYRERVGNIYLAGIETLSQEGLEKLGIEAQPFPLVYGDDMAMTHPVLIGTAMQTRYDFTSERLRSTKKITGLAQISMGISVFMLAVAAVFLFLGIVNLLTNKDFDERIADANSRNASELAKIEQDYAMVSKSLDLANVNNLVQNYKEFQAEPKLPAIVNAISQKVPPSVFLTKIEVKRPEKPDNDPQVREGTPPEQDHAAHVSRITHFEVDVQGVINVPYPRSREVFSQFLSNLQGVSSVASASYTHKQDQATFGLKCKVKI